jgi:FdrA protein
VGKKAVRTLAELLRERPAFLNVGVREFAESVRAQGAKVVHVDWRPPAAGDAELAELLDKLL